MTLVQDMPVVKAQAIRQEKLYIYIAGPYSKGDMAVNVMVAIHAADFVKRLGHEYYLPHTTHFEHMMLPKPYEYWMEHDSEWLKRCTALVRLDGESSGADREVAEARALGLPVFMSLFEIPKVV